MQFVNMILARVLVNSQYETQKTPLKEIKCHTYRKQNNTLATQFFIEENNYMAKQNRNFTKVSTSKENNVLAEKKAAANGLKITPTKK